MQIWHRLSLEQKTITLFAGFLLLASANAFIVHILQNKTADNASIVAGWQRAATATKNTFHLIVTGNLADHNRVDRQLQSYEQLLTVFRKGGIVTEINAAVGPAKDEEKFLLEKIHQSWSSLRASAELIYHTPAFKDTLIQYVKQIPLNENADAFNTKIVSDVQQIAHPAVIKAWENIKILLPEWSEANEHYIKYLLQKDDAQRAAVTRATLIFWALTLAALSIILFKIRKDVFLPLKNILLTGEMISKGNYKARVKKNSTHELGHISEIFNKTADTLQGATSYIQALGQGKLNNNLLVTENENVNKDTITGALTDMQRQMQKIAQQEKERNWVSEGLTKFGDLLRTNSESVEKLTNKVTSALVKYTGSLVGGTYLLNDNPKELELVALYALNTKKYQQRKFKPGEGLVGQTFLEEDYIYLLEIPENYISVTTGIGETSPKAILLMPLKVEDEVFGVIELASLKEYHAHEIEFVKKLCESIAATIKNLKVTERTKKLLQESQEMTELMRGHEEEMRQNMEELTATQEEMERKKHEVSYRLEAINNTLALAEYDPDKKIIYANKNFALLYKYPQPDLQRLDITNFIPDNDEALKQLNELWNELKSGKMQQGDYRRVTGEGVEILTKSTFTPVKNGDGKVIKVIELTHLSDSRGDNKEDQHVVEMEKMLRYNMEALDITQQKLKQQLNSLKEKYHALEGYVIEIIADEQGNILNASETLPEVLGAPVQSMMDFQGLDASFSAKSDTSGLIYYKNKGFRYIMKKMENGSYLFLLMII